MQFRTSKVTTFEASFPSITFLLEQKKWPEFYSFWERNPLLHKQTEQHVANVQGNKILDIKLLIFPCPNTTIRWNWGGFFIFSSKNYKKNPYKFHFLFTFPHFLSNQTAHKPPPPQKKRLTRSWPSVSCKHWILD